MTYATDARRPLLALVETWRERARAVHQRWLSDEGPSLYYEARHYEALADELEVALAAEEPRRQTREAERLDAMITAFETLQDRGYFLHDTAGHALDKQGFVDAMVIAGNAVLASLAAARAPLHDNPLQAELLDLITLMPDAQVDEILSFVATLREARCLARAPRPASPAPADTEPS